MGDVGEEGEKVFGRVPLRVVAVEVRRLERVLQELVPEIELSLANFRREVPKGVRRRRRRRRRKRRRKRNKAEGRGGPIKGLRD